AKVFITCVFDLHANNVIGLMHVVERPRVCCGIPLPPGVLSKVLINLADETGLPQLFWFIDVLGELWRTLKLGFVDTQMNVLTLNVLKDSRRRREILTRNHACLNYGI